MSTGKLIYTKEAVLKALVGSGGVITNVAKKLKCDWGTAKRAIHRWPETVTVFDAEREKVTDEAENQLQKAIRSGDLPAVKFWLTTIGKHRGFTERHEVTGADGGPIQATFIAPEQFSDPDEWEAYVREQTTA